MHYPYIASYYLLHVLLLKLIKMLANTPPTHHWTGILNLRCESLFQFMNFMYLPIYVHVYDQRSLRIIPHI